MSLFKFYSTYHFVARTNSWSRYNVSPILRIFPRPPKQIDGRENEEYYKLQVKLHVPWVDNISTLNPDNDSWLNIFNFHNQLVPEMWDVDEVQEEEEEFENEPDADRHNVDLEDWQNYFRVVADDEINDLISQTELGLREQDNINWSESYLTYENPEDLRNFVRSSRSSSNDIIDQVQQPIVELSNEQQLVMDVIEAIIHFETTGVKLANYRESIIVQGCAGSGKSTLIRSIIFRLEQEQSFGQNSYFLMALTGSAASNINGATIHSTFSINVNKDLNTLSAQSLHILQDKFSNCKFLIIDEMSLLGCTVLGKLDLRCRSAKANNRPFGGMHLILLGDLKQLPPVLDRPLYGNGFDNAYSITGQFLYRQIDASIILPTSHRQNDVNFRELLGRLGDGNLTRSDWQQLNRRAIQHLDSQNFSRCVRLFHTNQSASEYNLEKLRQFQSVLRVKAINNPPSAEDANTSSIHNLENVVFFAIGLRVMLRKNLWVAMGLVNGALRTVTDIVVSPGNPMPV